jgi:acetyl esterase/lipase
MPMNRRSFLFTAPLAFGAPLLEADRKTYAVEMKTVTYATHEGADLLMDLYLPQGVSGRLPVIVFLHGGGWSGGSRTTGPDFKRFFAQDGFAMASIEYRLVPKVVFPAPAEDVKTAIRWLRANAGAYSLNPQRIGLWGTSAGGHLAGIAALAPKGTFEGEGITDQPSTVQCVLDAYGPSSFNLMDAQTEEEKATLQPPAPGAGRGQGGPPGGPGGRGGMGPHDGANSAESRLVGAPIQTVPDKVRAASPLTYVRAGAPPFLLMHGLADNSVPHHQSVMMYDALSAAGNEVTLRLVDGLPHTFFNRTDLDEAAGPFRMDVRYHPKGGSETKSVDRAGVFDVARDFFARHLS